MHHSRGRWGRGVAKWRPSVKRPKANQNTQAEHHQGKHQALGVICQHISGISSMQYFYQRERFVVQVKEDKSSQGQECSDTQVEGNLVGGKFFVLATSPYTDHDKSGDQRQFVKEIHKEHVQRHKGTQNATTHQ